MDNEADKLLESVARMKEVQEHVKKAAEEVKRERPSLPQVGTERPAPKG